MSDITKIDNHAKGQKAMVIKQLAKGKDDLSQVSITIDPDKITAEELNAQFWQLGINFIDPWAAKQDATRVEKPLVIYPKLNDISNVDNHAKGQKTTVTKQPVVKNPKSGSVAKHPGSLGSDLKDIGANILDAGKNALLWPLRKAAYRISRGSACLFVPSKSIFTRLISGPDEYHGANPSKEGDISVSTPTPNILRICLCLDPNTLPISEYRPKKISDDPGQIYYSIKSWSKIRELNSKSGSYVDNGFVLGDSLTDKERDQIKDLFEDYEASERTASEFKPNITNDDIAKLDINKDWKSALQTQLELRKKTYNWPKDFLQKLLQLKSGEITYLNEKRYWNDSFHSYSKTDQRALFLTKINLGNYFMSFGRDGKGVYMSIYDIWDFKVGDGGFYKDKIGNQKDKLRKSGLINNKKNWLNDFIENMEPKAMSAITKPIYIYDRYYLSEKEIKDELDRRAHEEIVKSPVSEKSK